jgi:hypothetical protein
MAGGTGLERCGMNPKAIRNAESNLDRGSLVGIINTRSLPMTPKISLTLRVKRSNSPPRCATVTEQSRGDKLVERFKV